MKIVYRYVGEWPKKTSDIQKGDMSKVVDVKTIELKTDSGTEPAIELSIEYIKAE